MELRSFLFISLFLSSISVYSQTCTTYPGIDLGSGNIGGKQVSSPADCCTYCNSNNNCIAWTFDTGTCYIKDNTSSNNTKSTVTSGLRGTAPNYTMQVDTSRIVNEVDELYRSVTIDTTTNRQFFDLNWSDPNIVYLMKELGPLYVRVGGSGGDQDGLRFNGTNCSQPQDKCIDPPLFQQVYNIVVTQARGRLIWGLQYTKYPNGSFDYSHGQEDFMKYCSSNGYIIYGFQLGNEQQSQVDDHPDIYAADFNTLNMLCTKYWPDASIRPKLYGPDDQLGPNWGLQQFLMQVKLQNVPMVGITSHEYYGMDNPSMVNGQRLDSNWQTASNWTATLNQYFGTGRTIQMVADEIGPSIGGAATCSDDWHRFNVFADGFWYLDSLASHAQAGYQIFCRQDFYGIDYAIIDCVGHFPVPDYYLGIVWNIVNGPHVFNTTRPLKSGSVRPYAQCSKQYPGGLTVMVININQIPINLQVALTGSDALGNTREDYLMTAPPPVDGAYPDGIYGKKVQLNGQTLNFTVGGQLPTIKPQQSQAADKSVIAMPEYSYGFFVFPNANVALCKSNFGKSKWRDLEEKLLY